MKTLKILTLIAASSAMVMLAGCTPADESNTASGSASITGLPSGTVPDSIDQVMATSMTPDFLDDDLVWDQTSEVEVALSDSGSIGGPGVGVDGSVVTISKPGTYRISGTLSDGQVAVDGTGVVRIILDQASITNNSSSALVASGVDKLIVITAEDTTNTLTDATAYVYPDPAQTEPDAALFSQVDTVIGGDGVLVVNGRATDAIASKDGLVIASGTVNVTAVDDGIEGGDYLVVSGGDVTVTSGGQGLKSTKESDETAGYVLVSGGIVSVTTTGQSSDCVNAVTNALFTVGALTLTCTDDAIHADNLIMVDGGEIRVPNSYEGLESATVVISDGKVDVTSSDDAINANGGRGGSTVGNAMVAIRGGDITLNAGGDGIDSNGTILISGGTTVAAGANHTGDGAVDSNGSLQVTGGTMAAIGGSSRMLKTPDESSPQQWFSQDVAIEEGDAIAITTSNGTFSFKAARQAQNIVFTSPDLGSGATLTVGGGDVITPDCHGG